MSKILLSNDIPDNLQGSFLAGLTLRTASQETITLLQQKFSDPSLAEKLISTHPNQLVEGNTWGDRFWGVDLKTRLGQNRLGRLLMILRDGLIVAQEPVRNLDSF